MNNREKLIGIIRQSDSAQLEEIIRKVIEAKRILQAKNTNHSEREGK